jgi:Ca2+-binding EF-hand superfamily protein
MMRAVLLALLLVATTALPRPAEPPADDRLDIVCMSGPRPVLLQAVVRPGMSARWASYLRELYAFLDRDGDGKLSEAEFRRAPSPAQVLEMRAAGLYPRLGEPGADFAAADSNRDGSVSFEEMAAYYRDGGVGPVQVIVQPASSKGAALSAELFRCLDRDGDGRLSRDELRRAAESLRHLDTNDDEWLTTEEILPSPPPEPTAAPAPLPFFVLTPGADSRALAAALEKRYSKSTGMTAEELLKSKPAATCVVTLTTTDSVFRAKTTDAILAFHTVPTQPALADGLRSLYRQQFQAAARVGDPRVWRKLERFNALATLEPFADRDGDGVLTEAELNRSLDLHALSLRSYGTLTISGRRASLFDLLDTDGDGRLSLRELFLADRVLTWDRDGDGALSPDELPFSFDLAFSEGPPDRRGPVASPTAPRPAVPEWFRLMDRNGDGYISRREFVGTLEEFRKLDVDGDGLISPEEAAVAKRPPQPR